MSVDPYFLPEERELLASGINASYDLGEIRHPRLRELDGITLTARRTHDPVEA